MEELLIEIRDQLETCYLARETRLSLMNRNSPNEFLVCFLLVSDRFEHIDELDLAVRNCLSSKNVKISPVNGSKLTILPA
tara:strand:- start:4415 stop:4654 length:240 start_codon:yes stop_codon:yes gene_type:complete